MFLHLPPLPPRRETEEWFGRLRAIILNIIEIVLLILAMITLIRSHARSHDPVGPPSVQASPSPSMPRSSASGTRRSANKCTQVARDSAG